MRRYEISDENWERIAPLLPGKASDPGRTAEDNRRFITGVLWIARSGAAWRDLPERFGPWGTVYQRFNRWSQKGLWQRIFEAMQDPDLEWLMVDSTSVRAHQQAAGQKSTPESEALGCSGFSTKLHLAVDALGNPLGFTLTPGQRSDFTQAEALVSPHDAEAVLADKGYDSDKFVAFIEAREAKVVIPSRKNRKEQREIDENLYKDRNKVERFINRIKYYRRIATRYDKTARNYLSFVYLASTMIWLL